MSMEVQNMQSQEVGVMPTRQEVDDFMRSQNLCCIASLDVEGRPQVATVAFSVVKECGGYLIGTSESSRKSHNVDEHQDVAMVVTDSQRRITVQIEGTARKLSQEEFEAEFAPEHYRLRPESLPFKDTPGQVHIVIMPRHLRFSDCRPHPWVTTEYEY